MTSFTFVPLHHPFPRWMGPYSPSRGNKSGFRIKAGKIKTWDENGAEWPVVECAGIKSIVSLVTNHWKGGRVLFLPNGFVIKPLQDDDEVSKRVLIGRFSGKF